MNKRNRIKKNEEFQEVFKSGSSVANRQFVIYMLDKPGQTQLRIGLSVSKKIGKAVVRNQIKRYIRQAIQDLREELKQDVDYVIIARMPTATMDFFETKKSLIHVLKIAKAFKK
ncbi:ribonuclease P protein component [Calidifontibacillus oryziterrae]|uniref:ribonuclease P protein component n=1 Tax=Calidifontibacillus oryziterrae TaxID=1191699 RepID=UPI000311E33E|nr:ribonuclease P protein component [Calidifontibacillus oryziterrae]